MSLLIQPKRAGQNETLLAALLQAKVAGLVLEGKRRFFVKGVEISADQSFTHAGATYLVEIDSGNMAKLLVGQYVLLNQLCGDLKASCHFLVIHTYKDYNPARTLQNLALIKEQVYQGQSIPFGAIHASRLNAWNGGTVSEFLALFAGA